MKETHCDDCGDELGFDSHKGECGRCRLERQDEHYTPEEGD